MKYESQTRAIIEYERRNYERITLKVAKGQKDMIKAAAAAAGMSINRYILSCVGRESGLDLTLGDALPWIDGTGARND